MSADLTAETAKVADERDAARYRYLRNRDPIAVFRSRGKTAGVWIDCEDDHGELTLLTGVDADAAIDDAMKETQR